MSDPTSDRGRMSAHQLMARLPGGNPPRYSKVAAAKWRLAAQLFAKSEGRVRLRILCDECGVSHRTAWRIREALRDSAAVLRERHDER